MITSVGAAAEGPAYPGRMVASLLTTLPRRRTAIISGCVLSVAAAALGAGGGPASAGPNQPSPPPGASWTPGPSFTVGGQDATTATDSLTSGDTVIVQVPGAGSSGPALPAGTQLQFFTASASQLTAPTAAGALVDAVGISFVAPDSTSVADAFLTVQVTGPAVRTDLVPAYGLAPRGLVPAPYLVGPAKGPVRFVGGPAATDTAPGSTVYAGGPGFNFVTTPAGSPLDSYVRYLTTVSSSAVTTYTTTPLGLATFAQGTDGYRLVGADGGVFSFGTDAFAGSATRYRPNGPVSAYRATPDTHGYWLAGANGSVFTFGDAPYLGSAVADRPAPITEIVPTADVGGYSLLAADGSIYSYGDSSYSSAGFATPYAWRNGQRAVAYVPALRGGAWEATSAGGVFTTSLADFYGAPASLGHLAGAIVAMVATPDGRGYWLAGADGGVFAYGDAPFYGSAVPRHPTAPIVTMARTFDGLGYRLFAADGGVFDFGDAAFHGSTAGRTLAGAITSGGT